MFGCAGHPTLLISSSSVVVCVMDLGVWRACWRAMEAAWSHFRLYYISLHDTARGAPEEELSGGEEFKVCIVIKHCEACSQRRDGNAAVDVSVLTRCLLGTHGDIYTFCMIMLIPEGTVNNSYTLLILP